MRLWLKLFFWLQYEQQYINLKDCIFICFLGPLEVLLWRLGISGAGGFSVKLKPITNLNDMVLEADVFFLLSASVLYVQYTNQIRSPASHKSIEYLKQYAW